MLKYNNRYHYYIVRHYSAAHNVALKNTKTSEDVSWHGTPYKAGRRGVEGALGNYVLNVFNNTVTYNLSRVYKTSIFIIRSY